MAERVHLDHRDLRAVVEIYRDLLRSHQDRLNRLNVYPVPDGDTGTNMALTIESVVSELAEAPPTMAGVCVALSRGSLMGARGNSGVILSQILRGVCDAIKGSATVDGPGLASALAAAAAAAYQAVMVPVEGTILTVVRRAAEGAARVADSPQPPTVVAVAEAAASSARQAVADTPLQLPVLAAAGVVDSGGSGLVLLLDALLHVLDGRDLPPTDDPSVAARPTGAAAAAVGAAAPGGGISEEVGDTRYEVMFLLEAPDEAMDTFKATWMEMGESIVVVGGDGIWNCHIHTDHIGAAIEAGIEAGRPRRVSVTDLRNQVEEQQWVLQGLTEANRVTSVVAVGSGPAVIQALERLGVARVVPGGQTMNPSTGDIVAAIEALDYEPASPGGVVVLPNNKNVFGSAEQAAMFFAGATKARAVTVVPTRGLVEALAALMVYDAKADLAINVEAMKAAAASVVSGEVVKAVRDASLPVGPVVAGDHLGFCAGDVLVVEQDVVAAMCALMERVVGDDHELVTLITGPDSGTEAEMASTAAIGDWLAAHRPGVTVEVHRWAYPHAAYLFSAE